MWVMLNDAALSIVADRHSDGLMVRARFGGDIERVFPKSVVRMTPAGDYLYRAVVSREDVADALTKAAKSIRYDDFKSSVDDDFRHDVYLGVWSVMRRAQAKAEHEFA